MEQMKDEEETQRTIHSNENKRVLEEGTSDTKEGFKKARYSWQIKGKAAHAARFPESKPLQIANEPRDEIDYKNVAQSRSPSITKEEKSDYVSTSFVGNKPKTVQTELAKGTSDSYKMDHKTDIQGKPTSETQTKFEILREMGTEYSERIEEFLKSQAGRGTFDSKRDQDDGMSLNKLNRNFSKDQSTSSPSRNPDIPQQVDANRGRLNFDSPQLNHHLFNISSWLWQKQELGCAIVDNVFNRTLEELGLSPDPEANLQATTRVTVENQSIEAAIHQQGLAVTDGIDEDTNESVSSNANSELESTDNRNHDSVDEAFMLNDEHESNDTLSETDEKTEGLDDPMSQDVDSKVTDMAQYPVLKSKNVNQIHVCTSVAMDTKLSRTSRRVKNSTIEMDVVCSSNEFQQKGNCDKKPLNTGKKDTEMFKIEGGACDVMDESEICSTSVNDKESGEVSKKGSDDVIDLAVSTAIMSQGLNFR